jgi:hypothetical protein
MVTTPTTETRRWSSSGHAHEAKLKRWTNRDREQAGTATGGRDRRQRTAPRPARPQDRQQRRASGAGGWCGRRGREAVRGDARGGRGWWIRRAVPVHGNGAPGRGISQRRQGRSGAGKAARFHWSEGSKGRPVKAKSYGGAAFWEMDMEEGSTATPNQAPTIQCRGRRTGGKMFRPGDMVENCKTFCTSLPEHFTFTFVSACNFESGHSHFARTFALVRPTSIQHAATELLRRDLKTLKRARSLAPAMGWDETPPSPAYFGGRRRFRAPFQQKQRPKIVFNRRSPLEKSGRSFWYVLLPLSFLFNQHPVAYSKPPQIPRGSLDAKRSPFLKPAGERDCTKNSPPAKATRRESWDPLDLPLARASPFCARERRR